MGLRSSSALKGAGGKIMMCQKGGGGEVHWILSREIRIWLWDGEDVTAFESTSLELEEGRGIADTILSDQYHHGEKSI